ncbi:MAG: DNA polymerase III subunit gamma/tau [Oscillospiraceae bacterium]|nr:DNA polymerase III subunit gamma/tau [Oscillospiraceae bacterium]
MYRALYRKYRPSSFTDVIGQEHITKTLENAVKYGKTSHAYLFTGSRGTGKTSCAKILAKAVNCLDPHNGNPCNECEICRGIDNGSVLDIIEIDAASNNGVDNIRDLREEANFTPAKAKYRVYIIDEVHMLSKGAYNALLKTLEEPPAHVIFILATTEVHMLPSTILSRCQRFDFKRIPPESIADRLKLVAEKENLRLTDDGAMLIARIADGAMRDALSLLDRCSSYDGEIDSAAVAESAGLAGREYIFELCGCVIEKNAAKAMEIINRLYNESCDMERLITELTNHFRNLMVSKAVKSFENMIICSGNEAEIIREQSEKITLAAVMSCIDVLTSSAVGMKQGANRRTCAELCLIRLCTPSLDSDINSILRRLSELERAVSSGIPVKEISQAETGNKAPVNVSPVKVAESTATIPVIGEKVPEEFKKQPSVREMLKANPENKKASQEEPHEAPPLPEPPPVKREIDGQAEGTVPFDQWPEVLDKIFSQDKSLIAMLTGSTAFIHDGKYLLIKGSPVLEMYLKTGDYSKTIKQAAAAVTGKNYSLAVYNNKREDTSESPLAELLLRARRLGVNIEEEQ